MKCYKGTILSVDSNNGVYRYIVEDNGIILYVGNDLPSEYNKAEIIDLTGKAITPLGKCILRGLFSKNKY